MKSIIYFIFIFIYCNCNSQVLQSEFNFGFEKFKKENIIPEDWFSWGDYELRKDSIIVNSGRYSYSIKSHVNGNSFGSIVYKLPKNYNGKEIVLEGYIKTYEVVNGSVGLIMRIDKNQKVIEFDNMHDQNIRGTNDWKKYTVVLPYHEDADAVYIGGILSGNGKAWFDDFKVYIDGQNIDTLKLEENVIIKQKLDNEFVYGSKFKLNNIDQKKIDNLYELAKTWGRLKYNHPKIAQGEYNFDYELFRILPIINSSKFKIELSNWENSFGEFEKQKLKNHYYVGYNSSATNPVFKNEEVYSEMNWEDDGYRLLALFRYWNMIDYFYPYKHLIDNNWDIVLKKNIPKFLASNDELSYKLAIMQLVREIQDSHAVVFSKGLGEIIEEYFGKNIAPLRIKIIDNKVVVTGILEKVNTKIKVGDIITKINGTDIQEIINQKKQYIAASNQVVELKSLCYKLLRTNDETLFLTIKNKTIKINCSPRVSVDFSKKDIPSHKEIDPNIGYIYPESLKKDEIYKIMDKFLNKKGIIIDLRCYPSDFIVFRLGEYLMSKPQELVKFSSGAINTPGEFKFSLPVKVGKDNLNYYKGTVAILVNESTQSNAEYTAMALQVAPHAKIIGSQTAGADGDVSEIYLPGNIKTLISGVGVYYPDGKTTQRIGIIPDIKVCQTIKGIKKGQDEVLDRAIKYIKTDK